MDYSLNGNNDDYDPKSEEEDLKLEDWETLYSLVEEYKCEIDNKF